MNRHFEFPENVTVEEVDQHFATMLTLYPEDAFQIIREHIAYFLEKDDTMYALQTIERYQQQPYRSMEIEQFLKEEADELRHEMAVMMKRQKKGKINFDLLESQNKEAGISFLQSILFEEDVIPYLEALETYRLKQADEKIDRLILIFLVTKKVDRRMMFHLEGKEHTFNPSQMQLPIESQRYKKMCADWQKQAIDPSELAMMKELYMQTEILFFPFSPFEEKTDQEVTAFFTAYVASLHDQCPMPEMFSLAPYSKIVARLRNEEKFTKFSSF